MCLDAKLIGKEKKAVLDKLPDEFWAWKATEQNKKSFYTMVMHNPLYAGLNKFKCNVIHIYPQVSYVGGCHLFLKKPPKNNTWFPVFSFEKLIHVKVKKKWIKSVGEQSNLPTITVSHAIFPKYCGAKPNGKTPL